MTKKEQIILEFMKDPKYVPMKAKEIATILGVPKKDMDNFKKALDNLEMEFKIGKNKKNRYRVIEENFEQGTFRRNQKGFGFVKLENRDDEIYISKENTNNALNGDRVIVEILEEKNKISLL